MVHMQLDTLLDVVATALREREQHPQAEPDTLTLAEAAEWLDVSRSALCAMMRRGELASITIGSRRFIQASAVHRLFDAAAGTAPKPEPDNSYQTHVRAPKRTAVAPSPPSPPPLPEQAGKARATGEPRLSRHLRALPALSPASAAEAEAAPVTVHTMDEAAELLGCSKGRVRAMLRDGRLTPVTVGRRVFVSAREVERLMAPTS